MRKKNDFGNKLIFLFIIEICQLLMLCALSLINRENDELIIGGIIYE